MKSKKEIKIIAQKIADIELSLRESYNPDLLEDIKNLIYDCPIEEMDLLDQEIKKILRSKDKRD